MRTPFERLMERVADLYDADVTLGQLAEQWGEPIDRIMDAIDAVRVCAGEWTYLPGPTPEGVPGA